MSPILVRPVREQLEHDRIIRLLPVRYKRRFEVDINPGTEQNAAVGTGPSAVYPDAVLYSTEKARKLLGVVEVETIESINHLEAMAEWAVYGRLKVPFHLYVPVAALDVARRLSTDHHVAVAEIWSFDNVGDQVRFTLVYKVPEAELPAGPAAKAAAARTPRPPAKAAKPAPKPAPKAAAPTARAPVKAVKPSRPAKPASRARTAAPARKAAPQRKPAAKPAAKRAPAVRGRAATARKGHGAQKRR